MNYVFLDIDGVLASERVHLASNYTYDYDTWSKFDPVAVEFMNRIHDTYQDVRFVLMSTWKDNLSSTCVHTRHLNEAMFRNANFRGTFANPWKTNPDNNPELAKKDRAFEVSDYLKIHAQDAEDFILFDDNRFRFKEVLGKGRLVCTNGVEGLTSRNMLDALSLMGKWKKRSK